MKGFPPFISALLLTSLVLTICRGLTLPFLAIYLSQSRGMAPDSIGLLLGVSLALGLAFSLYGGYLVDRFSKKTLIVCSMSVFSLSFFLLPLGKTVPELIILMALVNSAYALFSITLKACIADWLPLHQRIRAFSLNYTLVNVGWAVGPPLSVLLSAHNPAAPFYLAGAVGVAATLGLGLRLASYGQPPRHQDAPAPAVSHQPNFRQTLGILGRDRCLVYFTLGGTLGCLVYGQFAACISQFLMVAFDADYAYRVVGIILPVNAGIVITLQYLVSRHITRANLMPWLVVGSLFFLLGLAGFTVAGHSLPVWVLAVAIFSLGEIIVTPVEYLFIDYIAPAHLKGSYYGMQNLANLGGAVNPVLTGLLLTWTASVTLFPVLMLATLLSLGLFWRGYRTVATPR
ncbi:MFS transporter [Biostraticola tofi]|uniref:Putative MFS family arabinose efflux permease n=1 Tax=Biostraticola tofi TaxID=466109 RepID=A0A4R3Z357_9GAMM|nr:MFS transporter [Biostraticola tofi]TCW00224.1 putative MFS family arabinose efflux permease [Biostraticola tofi]